MYFILYTHYILYAVATVVTKKTRNHEVSKPSESNTIVTIV